MDLQDDSELRRLVDEQTALRRVATLVASGAGETELLTTVTSEIGRLFGAHAANTMRWDGDSIRVLGAWSSDPTRRDQTGLVYEFGGDTITARVVRSERPERLDSAADLTTEFAKERWQELGLEASIAAPIVVEGRIWGVVTASRRTQDDPFPPGAEVRLGDFAALVAQAIANAEARREVAALAEEQAALRRVATLVAAGRAQAEVLDAVTSEAGVLYGAECVHLVRWTGVHNEVVVVAGWGNSRAPLEPDARLHPSAGGPTLTVLETGFPTNALETSPELGERWVIAAPVILNAQLLGAITLQRELGNPFPAGAEVRLRSFGDLAAQSIANTRSQEEMRASRARIVRAGDEAREHLERNLHDGAQQRLVAVSISLRLALARLPDAADEARQLLGAAALDLTQAIEELRELARGIHPAILTERGLGAALEVLASRAPLRVEIENELAERLPPPVEAAAYYVVAESLTNVAKYAEASLVRVRVGRDGDCSRVEVVDDGVGGADASRGSGLRGLADRVEALDGRLGVESPPGAGTRVWAELPHGAAEPLDRSGATEDRTRR